MNNIQPYTGGFKIQKLCVLYLCIWSVSPPMDIGTIYRVLALGSAIVWFLIAFSRGFHIDKKGSYAVLFAVLVAFVALIQFNFRLSKVMAQISLFMLVIAFLMFEFYTGIWDELGMIHVVVLILLIIWNFRTFTAIAAEPRLARIIVRDDETIYKYLKQGIGGYSLIYGQVCIFPLIITWIQKQWRKNKILFIIGCGWLATYILTILHAGYSIAIACTVISTIILFFIKGRKVLPTVIVAAGLLFGALLLIRNSEGFRNFLLEMFDGTAVVKKINNFMTGEIAGEENSITVRLEAYKYNFIVLLKYPIIGGLWWNAGNSHSAIMSMFAQYGWFGGYTFCMMLFAMPNYYRKLNNTSPKNYRIINAVFVSTLFVGFLDAMPYGMIFMIVIVGSLFYRDIAREDCQ